MPLSLPRIRRRRLRPAADEDGKGHRPTAEEGSGGRGPFDRRRGGAEARYIRESNLLAAHHGALSDACMPSPARLCPGNPPPDPLLAAK